MSACELDSLIKTIFAAVLNGIGIVKLKERPSGFENNAFLYALDLPRPKPKKSPIGAETAGVLLPSQYISIRTCCIWSADLGMVPLNHMRLTIPAPVASNKLIFSPASNVINARPFAPLFVMPALPLAPVGFSGLTQIVFI